MLFYLYVCFEINSLMLSVILTGYLSPPTIISLSMRVWIFSALPWYLVWMRAGVFWTLPWYHIWYHRSLLSPSGKWVPSKLSLIPAIDLLPPCLGFYNAPIRKDKIEIIWQRTKLLRPSPGPLNAHDNNDELYDGRIAFTHLLVHCKNTLVRRPICMRAMMRPFSTARITRSR